MTAAERFAEAGTFLDLRRVPFTLPGSRLLVRRADEGLSVSRAEYEVDADDAIVVASLTLRDPDGSPLPVTSVQVDRIGFGDGAATLTFGGPMELSLGGSSMVDLGDGSPLYDLSESDVLLVVGDDRRVDAQRDHGHARRLAGTQELWLDWFARCPDVRPDLAATAAHCWWVLGANQVELGLVPGSRAVVPSKLGYVALWQWDAYFIAIGLRHGDLVLAAEQLELALRFATLDGQLPDVVHDTGVLSSSDDLPPADLARLRELGSPAADPTVPVPLTKPPLAALALALLADSGLDRPQVEALLAPVVASQRWWLESCLASDGLPEYAHPYSSGLDDSPVFDTDLPVATPDLAAYLELQDLLLADLLDALRRTEAAARHRARARASAERLLRLWRTEEQRFGPRGGSGPLRSHTVLDLLPLLTGTLPAEVVRALVADLADPASFAAPHPVPTVAMNEPAFSARRMWRGPTWVNTNWLLIEGLLRSGEPERAACLANLTLALVVDAGGAFEYYDPRTGRPAPAAAPAFAWTAALFLDLAVRFAPS
ncbi:MAG: hypothetical protein QM779_15635 [Propionicimonas sp.]|uniref:MGH1-like glycoside hydrolase domain-containing protein n=1 Tax=Propionicimonas sp. TaxID=1955623 RepID=UPI003D15255A